jgi:hypothetical protein
MLEQSRFVYVGKMRCVATGRPVAQDHAEGPRGNLTAFPGALSCSRIMSTRPSVMGPMRSSPPSDCHAAELTLLSVVDAKAATLCC